MQQAADLYLEKEKDLYIQTVKGRRFYMSKPSFDIQEIAHATAMQCRFTGHVREFYSVAEHSVLVSRLLAETQGMPELAFEGLMHDAHEAYVSDIASPWKALIPDYRKMEARLEAQMRMWCRLPEKHSEAVKLCDWIALFIEAEALLPPGVSDDWLTPTPDFRSIAEPIIASRMFRPRCLNPKAARIEFLFRYEDTIPR